MSSEKAASLLGKLSGADDNKAGHPALKLFSETHPLTKEFDFSFLGVTDGVLKVRGMASEKFANIEGKKQVHSSFISLFLDTVMGSVVLGELEKPQPIATLNITVNHHIPANVGEQLICSASFQDDREEVAYVTGEITREADGKLIASSIGTFMIGTRAKPMPKA